MARISAGADGYLYVPAWDFTGASPYDMAYGRAVAYSGAVHSYFTVNDIGGSVIGPSGGC